MGIPKIQPSIPFVKYCPHKIETDGSRLPGSTKSEKIYSETLSTMLFDLFWDGMYRSLYTGPMPTQMPPHAYAEWKRCLDRSFRRFIAYAGLLDENAPGK